MKKLLLHTCCADCMLKFVDSNEFDVTTYYYNPNIHPRTEYLARLEAIKAVTKERGIKLIVPDWSPKEHFACFLSLGDAVLADSKARCPHCWLNRLTQSAKFAKENGFTSFSTTLLSSHYQDFDTIMKIGLKLAKEYELTFEVPKELHCELKTGGFYKQNYCGCVYSLKERMEEKFLGKVGEVDATCG